MATEAADHSVQPAPAGNQEGLHDTGLPRSIQDIPFDLAPDIGAADVVQLA